MPFSKNAARKALFNLIEQVEAELVFRQEPGYEIANHFREALRRRGYAPTPVKWEETKKWANKVRCDTEYTHISISDWKACIDWLFVGGGRLDQFWSQVRVERFETVVKAYNSFQMWREQQQRQQVVTTPTGTGRPIINYGKKR